MSSIQVMPDDLASQVAAGEVVERPASVVKELIENSIDAGSSHIDVQITKGGLSLVRITDDGCGMRQSDALLAMERHATSKITRLEDLAGISTLGFRGEALPSIASVSRLRLTTREKGAPAGTEVTVHGGKLVSVNDTGCAPGTQVEMRSLFYNVPARRKFTRTENTEFSHIEHQVRVQALAHPEIGFVLTRDGRLIFRLAPVKDVFERIRDLTGPELGERLLSVRQLAPGGVEVHGYIGEPGVTRSNRVQQMAFLNGRPIESPLLTHALREGYHPALSRGQYPVCFLYLSMPPNLVDVNVHPAKREVRFLNPAPVRDAVAEAVRRAIEKRGSGDQAMGASPNLTFPRRALIAGLSSGPPKARLPATPRFDHGGQPGLIPEDEQHALRHDWSRLDSPESKSTGQGKAGAGTIPPDAGFEPPAEEEPESDREPEARPPLPRETPGRPHPSEGDVAFAPADFGGTPEGERADLNVLGLLGGRYVVLESGDGLVLMDRRAAHERVLYESVRRRVAKASVESQRLLIPLTLQLDPRDFDLIRENLPAIRQLGVGMEEFGPNTVKVDALPGFLKTEDPLRFVHGLVDELKRAVPGAASGARLDEEMVISGVCRQAVRASDFLHQNEVSALVRELFQCEMPYCCPLGRPTLVQFSYGELERRFGR